MPMKKCPETQDKNLGTLGSTKHILECDFILQSSVAQEGVSIFIFITGCSYPVKCLCLYEKTWFCHLRLVLDCTQLELMRTLLM